MALPSLFMALCYPNPPLPGLLLRLSRDQHTAPLKRSAYIRQTPSIYPPYLPLCQSDYVSISMLSVHLSQSLSLSLSHSLTLTLTFSGCSIRMIFIMDGLALKKNKPAYICGQHATR